MLSRRGMAAASPERTEDFWEIMADQYCATTNQKGYINLGVAENALMHDELMSHLKHSFDPSASALTYGEGPSGSKRLRAALAAFLNRYFAPVIPVQPSHIDVSNGVTASIERCALKLGDPEDGFLLGQPYYGSYPSNLGRAGIQTIPVPFKDVDPFSVAAVTQYEAALLAAKSRFSDNLNTVRALVLCSPHNPLGRCYPRDTLIAIMQLCQKYKLHLISDEVYALSVFTNPDKPSQESFTSVLAIDPTGIIDPALVHVLWGLSKDFGANSLRIGCVISQANPAVVTPLDTHAPCSYPSALLDYAAYRILEDKVFMEKYIAENQRRLAKNYAFTVAFLKEHHVEFYPGTNAGFFVWVNLGEARMRWKPTRGRRRLQARNKDAVVEITVSEVTDDINNEKLRSNLTQEIMVRLVEHRVFLANGDTFGSEHPGWFRVVFSQPRQLLHEGLRRMVAALEF